MSLGDDFHYQEETIPDGYMMVRGLAVPIHQIEAVEQLYSAQYINEVTPQNRSLILRLDRELESFRQANDGAEPEFIKFVDIGDAYFKHMPITNQIASFKIPIKSKPAWFKFTRKFSTGLLN